MRAAHRLSLTSLVRGALLPTSLAKTVRLPRLEPLPAAPSDPALSTRPLDRGRDDARSFFSARPFAESPIRDAVTLGVVTEAHLELLRRLSRDRARLRHPRHDHAARRATAHRRHRLADRHLCRDQDFGGYRSDVERWQHETTRALTASRVRQAYAALLLAVAIVYLRRALALPATDGSARCRSRPRRSRHGGFSFAHARYSHDGRPGGIHATCARGIAPRVSTPRTSPIIAPSRARSSASPTIPPRRGRVRCCCRRSRLGWRGEHVNILGANRFYKGLTTADLRDVDEQALALASLIREP